MSERKILIVSQNVTSIMFHIHDDITSAGRSVIRVQNLSFLVKNTYFNQNKLFKISLSKK